MRLTHLIFFSVWSLTTAWGQTADLSREDSLNRQEWLRERDSHSVLFTGKEQTKYSIVVENHPFFFDQKQTTCFLTYDGVDYPNVTIKWDIYKDEIAAVSPDQRYNILLVPTRFQGARSNQDHIYYINKQYDTGVPASGYYLNLYNQKYKVWKKPYAVINEKHENQQSIKYFTFHQKYYIEKDGIFHPVKNISSILKVFKDKKKELKQYVKKQKLKFKSTPETTIPAIVQKYEQLTQTEKP